jgi:hypothetical protein
VVSQAERRAAAKQRKNFLKSLKCNVRIQCTVAAILRRAAVLRSAGFY